MTVYQMMTGMVVLEQVDSLKLTAWWLMVVL